MRSIRQVHVYSNEISESPIVRKNNHASCLSNIGFLILLIITISLIIIASITIPLVLIKNSQSELISDSTTTPIPTIHLRDSTSTIRETTTLTTESSTLMETSDLSITSSSMIDFNETEEYSTDDNNSTLLLTDTSTSTTTTTITTTTQTPRPPFINSPNLLINPGAELGTLVGWTQAASAAVIIDSNGQFNSGYYPRTGRYCFAGGYGTGGSTSRIIQNVKVVGGIQNITENLVNTGSLRVELEFFYQTWDTPFMRNDQAEITLAFRSATSSIRMESTKELACKVKKGWCRYFNTFPIPIGTRSIDYIMSFIRRDVTGNAIDSYTDDNSLKII